MFNLPVVSLGRATRFLEMQTESHLRSDSYEKIPAITATGGCNVFISGPPPRQAICRDELARMGDETQK